MKITIEADYHDEFDKIKAVMKLINNLPDAHILDADITFTTETD